MAMKATILAWFCLDCRTVCDLDIHGRCERCGSEAVTFGEGQSEVTYAPRATSNRVHARCSD